MKLKGNPDNAGILDLFRSLADERATGILAIASPMGEKYIAVREGAVSVFADKLSDRARLGDLLVARGQLSEAQLAAALKFQREQDPRSKLGDILVKKGLLDADSVNEVLRFQLAEEIFDLFTWKGTTFEFNNEMTVADVTESRTGYKRSLLNVAGQRRFFDSFDLLPISDAQTLLVDIGAFASEWDEIQKRLTSSYICFKLTPKAEAQLPRASASTQKVIGLLKEGRTLETTIKRSCLGRLAVSKLALKLLDDGWLSPYPLLELRALASEHRARKRFWDALNIYRRLLENATVPAERAQVQQLIDDTIDSLLRAKVAGQTAEGVEAVNYKAAARQYLRRQRHKRLGLAIFCFLSFPLIAYLLLSPFVPKAETPEAFQRAMKVSAAAVEARDFNKALRTWKDLWQSIHDKDSEIAKRVFECHAAVAIKLDTHVKSLMHPLEESEKQGRFDDAEKGYRQLMEDYPRSSQVSYMEEGLSRIAAKRETKQRDDALAQLQQKLQEGRGLLQRRQLVLAKAKFAEVAAEAEDSAPRREAGAELAKLALLEKRSQDALAAAQTELRRRQGQQALSSFEQLLAEWPDLPAAETARQERDRLKARLARAQEAAAAADLAEKEGNLSQALTLLRETQAEYGEFELAAGLNKRIAALDETAKALNGLLEEARKTYRQDKPRGRELYAALIKEHAAFLHNQKVELPVRVNATPQATLKMDDKIMGLTPLEIAWPFARPVALVFERPGYQREERNLARLSPDDLEIMVRLKRAPVCVLEFQAGIFASPRVLAETLYVLHGASLSALEPSGRKELWVLNNLFDDKAQTRPASSGNGPDELVADKSWWCPRQPPEPFGDGALLLPLRSRGVLEIDARKAAAKTLFTLPVEPVGRPYSAASPLLADRMLVAAACADGKIRAFDPAQSAAPLWERPVDPANAPPKGALAAGLAPRANGVFLALSVGGRLTAFGAADGHEQWNLDLKTPVTVRSLLPPTPAGALAVCVHANGALSVVEVNKHERLWQLPAQRAMDEAVGAATDQKYVYLITRAGLLRKYDASTEAETRTPLWERPLDGPAELPLSVGKLIYAVSTFGTVYALAPEDGRVVWDYRPEKKPDQLGLYKEYLYLATGDGRVLIMNAE